MNPVDISHSGASYVQSSLNYKRVLLATFFCAALAEIFPYLNQKSPSLKHREITHLPCPPSAPSFSIPNLKALSETWRVQLIIDPERGEERPIIREKAIAWAESHCGKRPRELAYKVLDHITYISREEFEHQLADTVQDFNQQLKEDPKYIALVGPPEKSSPWVLSMALPYLDHLPIDVITVDDLERALKEHPEVKQIVVFDDAAYSGAQMSYLIHMAHTELEALHKDGRFKVHIVIPYQLNSDNLFLQKNVQVSPNVKIAKHKTFVPVKKVLPSEDHELFRRMFRDENEASHPVLERPLAYFSHMTPDALSVAASDALRHGAPGKYSATRLEAFSDALFTQRGCSERMQAGKLPFIRPADPPYKHQCPRYVRHPKNGGYKQAYR